MSLPRCSSWRHWELWDILKGHSDLGVQQQTDAKVCAFNSPCSVLAGNSLSALLDGKAKLTFLNRKEEYTLTMPYAHCRGE